MSARVVFTDQDFSAFFVLKDFPKRGYLPAKAKKQKKNTKKVIIRVYL